MSDIAMSVTMDEKDVQRALQAMVKENAKLRAEIGLGVQESKAAAAQEREWQKLREKATKDATQQMQQLNNAAQRIKDSVATPFEEAKKKAAELRDHLQAGRITVDEYRKAYAAVGKEMKEASRDHAAEAEAAKAAAAAKAEASRLAAEAEREHSQAVREATAVADKYATKEERVAAELKRLNTLKEKGVLSSKDYTRAVEAEQKKLNETGDAADKSGGLIGGLTTKMGGFVSGLASVAAVVAVLRSEYDGLIERQNKSKDANISLAAAQSDALDNLDASMTPAEFAKRMKESSNRLGMSERDLTVAASSALSAKGDKSAADAISAVEASAKLNRFAPEKLPDMAASTLDLGKHLKMKPEEALGFLIGVGQSSRVVSLKNTAENIAPAIIGGVSQGIPKEKAAAIAASITGTAVDSTGKPTNTTMQALFGQLKEFGSAEYGFTGGSEHQQKVAALEAEHVKQKAALKAQFDKEQISLSQADMPAAQKAEAKRQLDAKEVEARAALKASQEAQQSALSAQMPSFTPEQMLDRIMKDPELKATFFRDKKFGGYGASFEKAMMPAVNQLLTPGTQGHADYQAALAAQMKVNPQQLFDNAVKAKESLAPIQIATQDQKLGNAVNTAQLRDVAGAESAVIRQQLDEFRAAMGDGYFTRTLKGVFNDVKTGGVQTYDSAIRSIESDIGEKQKSINYRSNLAPAGDREFKSNPAMAAAQKRDEELVKAMREMVDLLKEQRDVQQQNAANNAANEPRGIIPADGLRKPLAPKPIERTESKDADHVSTMPAGNVKRPKQAPTAAEQEYAAASQDLWSGTTKKKRDRLFNAEQALSLEMPAEYKTAVEHQTAVLERIAAQGEQNNHAGRVQARAQEGRP